MRLTAVLADEIDGFAGDGQEKARDVEYRGSLDHGLGFCRVEMIHLEKVRCRQVRDEGTFAITRHKDRAGPSRCVGSDHVLHVDAVASGLFLHLGRVLVVTDAPEVRSRVRLPGGVQHPLCDANRVLARSTGNVVHLVVFDKFSVHGLMFLFCEHCIARLDAVPVASQQHRRRIIIIIIIFFSISKAKRL